MQCPACGHQWKASGVKSQIDEAALRAAYEKADGNISQVARELGHKYQVVRVRATGLGLKGTGHRNRRPDITDEMMLEVLQKHGSHAKAAEQLRVNYSLIRNRLKGLPAYEAWKVEARKQRRISSQHLRNEEIAKAVAEAGGNLTGAAVILGLTRERVRQLWNRVKESET